MTGHEAIRAVEAAICGDAAVSEPAVAEGLALSGQRAAGLPSRAVPVATAGAPWVHHRITAAGSSWGEVELWASTAQEAVDHSLVAHQMTQRAGVATLCALTPGLAARIELCRLPTASQIEEVLQDAGPFTSSELVDAAGEAFARLASASGRAAAPLEPHCLEDAELVCVGAGPTMAAARRAVDLLREAGHRVGALSLRMLRPLPHAALKDALAGKRVVLLEDSVVHASSLPTALRLLGDVDVLAVEQDVSRGDLARGLAERLPGATLPADPSSEVPAQRIAAAPAGPWGDAFLRRLVTLLGRRGAEKIEDGGSVKGAAALLCSTSDAAPAPDGLDVLVVPHPAWLDPEGVLGAMREDGTILLSSAASDPGGVWWALTPAQRELVLGRRLRIAWVNAPAVATQTGTPAGSDWVLAGALVESGAIASGQGNVGTLATALEEGGRGAEAALVRAGSEAVGLVQDPASLKPPREEIDFRTKSPLPTLPRAGLEAKAWRPRLHRFHLTGEAERDGLPGMPLRPALMANLLDPKRVRPFPLVLRAEPGGDLQAVPLGSLLTDRGLEGRVESALEGVGRLVTPNGLPSLVSDDAAAASAAIGAGKLLGLGCHAPLALQLAAQSAARAAGLAEFSREVTRLRLALEDLLQLDRLHSPEGQSAQALSRSFGSAASFLNAEALARIPSTPGSKRMAPERRERIQRTLDRLAAAERASGWVLIHQAGVPAEAFSAATEAPQTRIEHADPCGVALGVFDGLARGVTDLLRAVRVARLEAKGNYVSELHDDALRHFSWEAFAPDELLLIPPVVVVMDESGLEGPGLSSFFTLLRSSKPVRALVLLESTRTCLDRAAPGFAYQAVAQREALVLQSSLARPAQLVRGLFRMARSARPGVAFVEHPRWVGAAWPELWSLALQESREVPAFSYDPDAGPTWADRFDLMENPQLERAWPESELRHLSASGEELAQALPFTFAHLAALIPNLGRHLWVVPAAAWDDAQVPVGEFLAAFDPAQPGPPQQVPYLWVLDEENRLQRAVLTRELVFACRDHARLWGILQELGGVNNEYARRAQEAALLQARSEADASRAELNATHQAELEHVRESATQDAVDHLVSVLLDPKAAVTSLAPPARVPVSVPAPPAPQASERVTAEAPAPAPEPEEELSFDEPYIDSALCTTCNECTNLNGELFQYNADKQATIADPAAGTFKELVQAAEACPVKIIHPGKPRAGDATVTDDLIERAGAFN